MRFSNDPHQARFEGEAVREDLMEALEKAYPQGFVFYFVDSDNALRQSGFKMNESKFLTAFYHFGLALAVLISDEPPDIPKAKSFL